MLMRSGLGLMLLVALMLQPAAAEEPEGFEPYQEMSDQFTLALPSGWSVYDQGKVLMGRKGKTGPPIIFSAEKIDGAAMLSGGEKALQKVMGQLVGVEIGEIPGFMLDRLEAKKGMSCEGFDKKAEKKLLKLVGTDPMFGKDRTTHEKPHADPASIGGCSGLRIKGKGETRDGDGKMLDIFAVSDGEVLYLFKLLNLEKNYSQNLETFEKIVSTLQLAIVAGKQG